MFADNYRMFLLIPLTLILASVIGISVIVFRKMPYLNKLTPETHARGDILTDLFPELSEGFKSLKLKEYANLWLVDLEKFLRRLRVVSLKMDRMFDSWIKKIRRGTEKKHSSMGVSSGEDINPVRNLARDKVASPEDLGEATSDGMKREEQRLIIEIAKNPKDAKPYEVLGDLYVKMNNFFDAKESFEAAIELNPNSEILQNKFSQVLKKMVI